MKPNDRGLFFQEGQDHAADAVASPVAFDGHAPDVGAFAVNVGQQTPGGDDSALVQGDGVNGVGRGVGVIHLHVGGDALLADENAHADGYGALQLGGGFDDFDGDFGCWVCGSHLRLW